MKVDAHTYPNARGHVISVPGRQIQVAAAAPALRPAAAAHLCTEGGQGEDSDTIGSSSSSGQAEDDMRGACKRGRAEG